MAARLPNVETKVCSYCLQDAEVATSRRLPCGHIYCRSCMSTQTNTDTIFCPMCIKDEPLFSIRTGSCTPSSSPSGENSLCVTCLKSVDEPERVCQICEVDGIRTVAVSHCDDCANWFCQEHYELHVKEDGRTHSDNDSEQDSPERLLVPASDDRSEHITESDQALEEFVEDCNEESGEPAPVLQQKPICSLCNSLRCVCIEGTDVLGSGEGNRRQSQKSSDFCGSCLYNLLLIVFIVALNMWWLNSVGISEQELKRRISELERRMTGLTYETDGLKSTINKMCSGCQKQSSSSGLDYCAVTTSPGCEGAEGDVPAVSLVVDNLPNDHFTREPSSVVAERRLLLTNMRFVSAVCHTGVGQLVVGGNGEFNVLANNGSVVKAFSTADGKIEGCFVQEDIIFVLWTREQKREVRQYDMSGSLKKTFPVADDSIEANLAVVGELVVVPNPTKNTVEIYDFNGHSVKSIGHASVTNSNTRVAAALNNSFVIADRLARTVTKVDARTGAVLWKKIVPSDPSGPCVDVMGRIWVPLYERAEIQVFADQGHLIKRFFVPDDELIVGVSVYGSQLAVACRFSGPHLYKIIF